MSEDTASRNRSTIRRLYEEAINSGKLELVPELVALDYVGPTGETGPAGFSSTIESLRTGIPDIHFTLEDLVAERQRVTVRWTWSGTHSGTFRGFVPSNRSVTNTGIAIYELRDGKIVRAWLETDRLGFLQQIGAVPAGLGAPPRTSK